MCVGVCSCTRGCSVDLLCRRAVHVLWCVCVVADPAVTGVCSGIVLRVSLQVFTGDITGGAASPSAFMKMLI